MIAVTLGVFLITLAIVADRFKVGLTTRTYVSAWQGRTSLLLFAAALLMFGLAHMLQWSNQGMWQRAFDSIWNGYEVFVGAGMALLGGVFAIAGKSKAPAQARWIAVAASVAGAIFLFDGLTKIMH